MNKKFYITTAIAYTSRKPHIGNAYDIVLADAIARHKKSQGYDVFLMTGSDEHGQKIEEYAKAKGIEPKAYVDEISAQIKEVWDSLDTQYDKFIRTTDTDHEETVKKIFKKLYEQGDIYKGSYEGKYCVPCESFFTASQLKDGKCPDCGRDVIDSKEEAYFLKLSKYADRLVKYYDENPDFFMPASRKAEMVNNFIKPGLTDLCVSRSSFKWGVPVDFDNKHVIYVWIDALSNYITGIGYDTKNPSEQYKKLWPADLHVIGKDIVRFHTIYWPIILMALGEPLPKQVLGHPWVLFGEDKMSKSKGNVIYADELSQRFGSDAVRYYLLSEVPFAQDGNITYEAFIAKFNTDLANTLGNLVNRSIAMTNKYFDGKVTNGGEKDAIDDELFSVTKETIEKFTKQFDTYHTADACETVMELARRCNKYIDETMPWALAKDESKKARLEAVMFNLLENIRLLSVLLEPIMPKCAKEIRAQLCSDNKELRINAVENFAVGTPSPLFSRLDADKVIEELTKEMEEKMKAAKAENDAVNTVSLAQIGIEDFMKVELKTAKIIECEPVKKAKKLLKLTLDDSSGINRTVASGIAKWYKPEDLIGHTVILVSNLKPAVLCGVESQGMILAADIDEDNVKVIFADDIPKGSKIR